MLNSSTLIETIVAMSILTIVFLIGISILVKSGSLSKSNQKLKAHLIVRKELNESIINHDYTNKTVFYEPYRLNITKTGNKLPNGLIELNFEVWNSDSVLLINTKRKVRLNETD